MKKLLLAILIFSSSANAQTLSEQLRQALIPSETQRNIAARDYLNSETINNQRGYIAPPLINNDGYINQADQSRYNAELGGRVLQQQLLQNSQRYEAQKALSDSYRYGR